LYKINTFYRSKHSADDAGVLGVRQYLPQWIQDEMIVCDGEWSQELVRNWDAGGLSEL